MIQIRLTDEQRRKLEFKHLEYAQKYVFQNLKKLHSDAVDSQVPQVVQSVYRNILDDFDKIIIHDPVNFLNLLDNVPNAQLESLKSSLASVFNYDTFVAGRQLRLTTDETIRNTVTDTQRKLYRLRSDEKIISAIERMLKGGSLTLGNPLTRKNEIIFNLRSVLIQYLDLVKNGNKPSRSGTSRLINNLKSCCNFSWGAYELVAMVDVHVCPYCNRNFVSVLNQKKGKTRPELDHFYPKSSYPHLGLSLYNLIPSCHVCNANLKRDEDTAPHARNCMNPYLNGFEDSLLFKIKGEHGLNYLLEDSTEFQIVLKRSLVADADVVQAENNVELFQLEKLYNDNHRDYVQDFLWKAKVYSPEYINELMELGVFVDKDEAQRFLVGNYVSPSDYNKRVLSKFTADICREFEII